MRTTSSPTPWCAKPSSTSCRVHASLVSIGASAKRWSETNRHAGRDRLPLRRRQRDRRRRDRRADVAGRRRGRPPTPRVRGGGRPLPDRARRRSERTAADVELRDRVLGGLGTRSTPRRNSTQPSRCGCKWPTWRGKRAIPSGCSPPSSATATWSGSMTTPARSPPRRTARTPRSGGFADCERARSVGERYPAARWSGGDAERASHPSTTRRRTDGERSRRDGASNGKHWAVARTLRSRILVRAEAPTPTGCCETPRSTYAARGLETRGRGHFGLDQAWVGMER